MYWQHGNEIVHLSKMYNQLGILLHTERIGIACGGEGEWFCYALKVNEHINLVILLKLYKRFIHPGVLYGVTSGRNISNLSMSFNISSVNMQ